MRTLSILLFSAMATLTACGVRAGDKNTVTTTSSKATPVQLDKVTFMTRVADIKSNPDEWKYLGDKPAIIDFYATWCGPCKQISPILEQLASEYEDELYVYKIDVDKEQQLARAFGITSIPTILFVPMEGAPQVATGALPKATFTEMIEQVLLVKN